ncbi:hydroxymethylglutaryl-CoA lyase [Megasphaera vaginalis (ex Srinivasan et al. 2021)]|nr:hydroxymethylglutaryl-CoA lyase [Megasphaera vaginalis (ex Srinivasan et al. 2021)]
MMIQKVNFIEVGPRDGFQNVKEFIPTEKKLKVIDMLVASGVKTMEIGSFVHPKAIPQMKDIKDVVTKTLEKHGDKDLDFFALVPNLYGAKAAAECGLKKIDTVISVSESHNKANINQTVEESLQGLAKIREALPDMDIILSMATSFTCPFEGKTPVENVLRIIREGTKLGIHKFCLADTIGQADPKMVRDLVNVVTKVFPNEYYELHIHDTRGMGVVCTLAGIEAGIPNVQAALGGLGGCPFAPGASGNVASEDLIYMFNEMGMETGISFERMLEAAKYATTIIDGNFSSHQIHIGEPCK